MDSVFGIWNVYLHKWYFSVILTLSSDEDDDKPGGGLGPLSGSGASGSPQPGAHPEPVNHKEPIITADMENFEDCEKEGNSGAVIGEYFGVYADCT